MNDEVKDMARLERELEKRFECSCEKNGWLASAGIMMDSTKASLVLERFEEDPIEAESVDAATGLLSGFIADEIGGTAAPAVDEEKIPTTRAPYHVTIRAEVDVAEWLKKVA